MSDPLGFPIGFVSIRTGLSVHILRAWERRYNAVTPARSASGRRMYSKNDIDRLRLLKRVTDNGFRISHIADLNREKLAELASRHLRSDKFSLPEEEKPTDAKPCEAREIVEACFRAVTALDTAALYQLLQKATLAFSRQSFLNTVITPLMETVGRRWAEGSLRIVHGQVAATVVHAWLSSMLMHRLPGRSEKPRLLIATPAGQSCYLGAMSVAIIAQDFGWEPIFLGPDLPSEEIAAGRHLLDPQLVALSITCRVNDAFMKNEFKHLSELLDNKCPIVIGGRASSSYRRSIESVGARLCPKTRDLIDILV